MIISKNAGQKSKKRRRSYIHEWIGGKHKHVAEEWIKVKVAPSGITKKVHGNSLSIRKYIATEPQTSTRQLRKQE